MDEEGEEEEEGSSCDVSMCVGLYMSCARSVHELKMCRPVG